MRLCCSLFVLAFPLAAQSLPGPSMVEGRVIDAATGEPVSKAKVTLAQIPIVMGIRPSGGLMGDNFYDDSLMPAQQVAKVPPVSLVTDDAGNFRSAVNPGRFQIRAERSGYVTVPAGITAFSLIPGETLKGIVIKLNRQGIITGRVVDAEGEPLAYVRMQCLKWTMMGYNGQRVLTQQSTTSTNDKGEYRLFGLSPAQYIVAAEAGPHVPGFRDLEAHDRAAYVTLYSPGVSDFSAAKAIDLAPGATRQGVDFQMKRVPVVSVSGRVLSGGAPGTMITLLPRDPALAMAGGRQLSAPVHPDGTFSLSGVPPGQYVLHAVRQMQQRFSGRLNVDVAGSDVNGLAVALRPGITLKGRIRADDAPPLDSVTLYFQPRYFGFSGGANSRSDSEGRFTAGPLDPETYRIQAHGLPVGSYVRSIRLGETDVTEALELAPGAEGELAIDLEWGTGEISGKVLHRGGQPASDILVTAVNERGETVRSTISIIDGAYRLTDLPPGTYRVFPVVDADISDPHTLDRLAAAAKEITLAKSAREGRNLLID
jgi:hypothetical protein